MLRKDEWKGEEQEKIEHQPDRACDGIRQIGKRHKKKCLERGAHKRHGAVANRHIRSKLLLNSQLDGGIIKATRCSFLHELACSVERRKITIAGEHFGR